MVHKVRTLDQHTPGMHPEICELWPHSWLQPAASQLAPHSLLSQSSSEDLPEYRLCLWFGALFMPFGLAHACADFDSGYLPAFPLSLASTLLPGTHNPTPSAVLWQGLVCLSPGKVHTPPVDSFLTNFPRKLLNTSESTVCVFHSPFDSPQPNKLQ